METGDPVSVIASSSCRTLFLPCRTVYSRRRLHAVLVAFRPRLLPILHHILRFNLLFAFLLCCPDSSKAASSLSAAEGTSCCSSSPGALLFYSIYGDEWWSCRNLRAPWWSSLPHTYNIPCG